MKRSIICLALCVCMALTVLAGIPLRKNASAPRSATINCDWPASPVSQ